MLKSRKGCKSSLASASKDNRPCEQIRTVFQGNEVGKQLLLYLRLKRIEMRMERMEQANLASASKSVASHRLRLRLSRRTARLLDVLASECEATHAECLRQGGIRYRSTSNISLLPSDILLLVKMQDHFRWHGHSPPQNDHCLKEAGALRSQSVAIS